MTDFKGKSIKFSTEETQKIIAARLNASGYRIYYTLKFCEAEGVVLTASELMKESETTKTAFYASINRVRAIGTLPEWLFDSLKLGKGQQIEKEVRDRLQNQLGGQTEVTIVFGRIDLLTEFQVIEVESIEKWKEALGQVQIYCSIFLTHQKRIHLFGNKQQLLNLPDIQSACLSFDVLVTGEEV